MVGEQKAPLLHRPRACMAPDSRQQGVERLQQLVRCVGAGQQLFGRRLQRKSKCEAVNLLCARAASFGARSRRGTRTRALRCRLRHRFPARVAKCQARASGSARALLR